MTVLVHGRILAASLAFALVSPLAPATAQDHVSPQSLPAPQAEALNDQHKVPLVYANVLLGQWSALKAAGVSGFRMPGRFFDEVGGMQLVIHSPYGSRINRAFGLALRKRFCVGFGYELQAAANEEALRNALPDAQALVIDLTFEVPQRIELVRSVPRPEGLKTLAFYSHVDSLTEAIRKIS